MLYPAGLFAGRHNQGYRPRSQSSPRLTAAAFVNRILLVSAGVGSLQPGGAKNVPATGYDARTLTAGRSEVRHMLKNKHGLRSIVSWGFFLGLLLSCAPAWGQVPEGPSRGQTVYVPAYSHIYIGDRETPYYLAVTLSIRNIDPYDPITVLSADYHDSQGKVIRSYIQQPVKVGSLAAIRYVVKETDDKGGSGASFIVKWKSEKAVSAPLVESVMIGTRYNQGISFTSRGLAIREGKK